MNNKHVYKLTTKMTQKWEHCWNTSANKTRRSRIHGILRDSQYNQTTFSNNHFSLSGFKFSLYLGIFPQIIAKAIPIMNIPHNEYPEYIVACSLPDQSSPFGPEPAVSTESFKNGTLKLERKTSSPDSSFSQNLSSCCSYDFLLFYLKGFQFSS